MLSSLSSGQCEMANGDEVIKQRRNNKAQDQIGSDEIRGKNANNSERK